MSEFKYTPLDEEDIDIEESGEKDVKINPLFKVNNQNKVQTSQDEIITSGQLYDSVKEIIDLIQKYVNLDGGEVKLVGIRNNWVLVKFFGACNSCAALPSTLIGLEESICEELPVIQGIEIVQE